MTLGYSWSLHVNPMRVLNYILGVAFAYTSLWMNEMKYVWMNEVDSMFSKEGSLVEVPYIET